MHIVFLNINRMDYYWHSVVRILWFVDCSGKSKRAVTIWTRCSCLSIQSAMFVYTMLPKLNVDGACLLAFWLSLGVIACCIPVRFYNSVVQDK